MEPNRNPQIPPKPKVLLGITFDEVHSDEPHEEIVAKKTNATTGGGTPSSHLSNHGDVFDVTKAFTNDQVERGTIVSDRRKQRPSLGHELGAAFKEWWGGTKKTLTSALDAIPDAVKTEEKPVVTKAETRADVVNEAIAPKNLAPKDDHKVVVEKVRTFAQDVVKVTGTPITLKAPEQKKSGWSHTVEGASTTPSSVGSESHKPTSPDMRGAMVAPVVTTGVIRSNTAFTSIPSSTKPTPTPERISGVHVPETLSKREVPLPKETVTVAKSIPHAVSKQQFVETTPAQTARVSQPVFSAPVTEPVKRIVPPPSEPVNTPVFPPKRAVVVEAPREFRSTTREIANETSVVTPQEKDLVPRVERREEPLTPPTTQSNNLIRYGILIGIVALGITLAIVASIYFNIFKKNPEPVRETLPTTTFLKTAKQTPLELTGSKNEFLTNLRTLAGNAPSGITQFYPTISDASSVRPATTGEVLDFIGARITDKTVRTLGDTFMIGSVTTASNEPFIILQTNSFDALFAGLLEWEPFLYEDFTPFFSPQSFGTAPGYTDIVLGNAPARALLDANGTEVLVYTFVNQHTLVISTSREALIEIISQF